MPWEHIGSCGNGQMPEDADWIDFCNGIGVRYIKQALGAPPEGCSIEVTMQDHDLGGYPVIGVHWDFPAGDAPWDYINRAEELLERFNDAVDWSELYPYPGCDEVENDDDEDEAFALT